MSDRETAVILQCTAAKRDGRHAARDIYDESDYFKKQRAYAEAVSDQWFIQSAKHGLLDPNEEIESYDLHATDIDDPEAWGRGIGAELAERVSEDATIEILGGRAYADPLTPQLEALGFEVHEPLRGQGIGERKKSLIDMANQSLEAFS